MCNENKLLVTDSVYIDIMPNEKLEYATDDATKELFVKSGYLANHNLHIP